MIDQLVSIFTTPDGWNNLLKILIFFLLAWLVHRLARPAARRIARLDRFSPPTYRVRPERQQTLQSLIANGVSLLAFAIAILATIGLFVSADTLVWVVGLFTAGFGLGARPVISNFLAGIRFIFEDIFAVGEKVEIMNVEGVIEDVSLQTTWMRSPTGELYIIPNGEILLVRNFSRGHFSLVNIKIKIATADLNRTLPFLEELGERAMHLLPNLLEPWQVISEADVSGQQTELTLVAKARFGMAAEMRPRMLALVQEQLAAEGIVLAE